MTQDYCSTCGSRTEVKEFDHEGDTIKPDANGKMSLCQFCSDTHLGNLMLWRIHGKQATLAMGIAQSFNILLKNIKETS